jgi:hypothetical protein
MLIPALLNATRAAPARDGVVRVRLHLGRVGDIRPDGERRVADLPGDRLDGTPIDVDAGDPRALLREPDRARASDAGARAGHDRDLARQSIAQGRTSCGTPIPPAAIPR